MLLPMVKGVWFQEDTICEDKKCDRAVAFGDNYFTDPEEHIYCESCGLCIRYERKKATQREINGEIARPIIGLMEE